MKSSNNNLLEQKKSEGSKLFKNTKQPRKKGKLKTEPHELKAWLSKKKLPSCSLLVLFAAVLLGVSWLFLCSTVFKEQQFCRTWFLPSFEEGISDSFKENKEVTNLKPGINVPNDDNAHLWVIERRSELSLKEFTEKYDTKRPVLITDAMREWKATELWNKEFFVKNYGDQQVVMKAVKGSLHEAESLALPMKLFGKHSHEGTTQMWTYLEDELFIQLHPELREHLGKTIYLEEDFFRLFPEEVRPWNTMLLWGTAYSRSALHIDPYNWTGTNAVFSGKKLWKLYPPGQDQYLYVYPDRESGFPLNCYKYNSPVDAFAPDFKKYPKFSKAQAISFEQRPGELLIIPPGWFHQAFNEVETIAISSQVMNSQNTHIILEEIFKAGNIDRKILPRNFYQLPAIEQVMSVVNSLPLQVLQRGRDVTNDILQQMGYPTK